MNEKVHIDRRDDALIVVDVQPDFMPRGTLPVTGGDEVVAPISDLLRRDLFHTVVATQDWHPSDHISFASSHSGRTAFESIDLYGHEQLLWPDHCVQGTPGAELHPALLQTPLSAIIRKGQARDIDSYSGFRDNHGPIPERQETGLAGLLRSRRVRRVVVCGLALDICVTWTALDAVAMEFEAVVIADLSRPVTADGERKAIEELASAGVIITSSNMIS